jgi:low temperature requirement protein LtrA
VTSNGQGEPQAAVATRDPGLLLRDHGATKQVGYVELFLDVVYVYVLVRLTAVLDDDLSWRGAYRELLVFLAVWWIWYRLAWTTNRYDAAQPAIQLMIIYSMLGSLFLAVAVARAFTDWGLIFASVYVAIGVVRYLWLLLVGRDPAERKISTCVLFWALVSAGPWLIGGFQHGWARAAWWSLAVFLDYLGGILDFPAPTLGRAGRKWHRIAEGHLADRYRQFLIISLGEMALVMGGEYRRYGFQKFHTIAVLITFATMVLLWQIYFYRAGAVLRDAIASAAAPMSLGELAWYSHLVMVAGIVVNAAGSRLVIHDPLQHSHPGHVQVIFGGPAVFLLGRGILDYATFSHISWTRFSGLIALAALVPAALRVPLTATAGLALVVLGGVAIGNFLARRFFPRAPSPPAIGSERTMA